MFPSPNQANAQKGMNGFNFGAQTNTTPAFGTPITKPTFGAANTSTFGTGGFGAPNASAQGSNFMGFGNTTATTAPALGAGFNLTGTPATGSAFGSTNTLTSTGFSGFGGTNVTSTSLGSVNTTMPTTGMGFGSTFGALNFGKPAATTAIATTTASAFGNFNVGFGMQQPSTGFQATQQVGQQQQLQDSKDLLARAIFHVNIYGDERDSLIAKWNYIQALWGTGKAYYSNNAPPMDITPENFLCRFKTITYYVLEEKDNKNGYVLLIFNKTYDEIRNQQQQIIQNLTQIFGNKSNLIICIDKINENDDKTHVTIYIDEKSLTNPNESRRIPSTDISNYLHQMQYNMQLTNMGIESIIPITMDKNDINKYLETVPKGIDPRMWTRAQLNNPNPNKFIPVPIYGIKEFKKRIEMQDKEIERQNKYVAAIRNALADIRRRHLTNVSRIEGLKRKLVIVTKRKILEIIAKQECTRKVGVPLTVKEEIIRNKLDHMNLILQSPRLVKGRLHEILARVRLRRHSYYHGFNALLPLTVADEQREELKEFFAIQLRMLQTLVYLVRDDLKIVNRIETDIPELLSKPK